MAGIRIAAVMAVHNRRALTLACLESLRSQHLPDATLDVFAAVSNPTRRVLLLSDVVARADDGASLSVDAVGQNFLRVSGTTASSASGRLGTVSYVISDGTDDEGARVEGEATVYLLPPAPELAPIAVNDTVVVRAGEMSFSRTGMSIWAPARTTTVSSTAIGASSGAGGRRYTVASPSTRPP